MKDLLAKYGKEGDNCLRAILEWMYERKGTWINKAELSLQRFPYVEKGVTKYFSPETIGRKARNLAELGLLERGEAQQAFYRWPQVLEVPKKRMKVYEPIWKDGRPMVREVEVEV